MKIPPSNGNDKSNSIMCAGQGHIKRNGSVKASNIDDFVERTLRRGQKWWSVHNSGPKNDNKRKAQPSGADTQGNQARYNMKNTADGGNVAAASGFTQSNNVGSGGNLATTKKCIFWVARRAVLT